MRFAARILPLVLYFLLSCKKDTQTTPPTHLGNVSTPGFEEMKAYAYFKPGTYWVYEDSLHPGTLDSVWVTQSSILYDTVKQANGGIQPGIYPYFLMTTKDLAGNTRDYSCYSEIAYFGTYNGLQRVEISWNGPTQYYGEYYFMHNRYIPGSLQSKYGPDTCVFIKTLDSAKIVNTEFQSILIFNNRFFYGTFGNIKRYNLDFYIARNRGVVKRIEIDSNRVWLLLRKNIIQ